MWKEWDRIELLKSVWGNVRFIIEGWSRKRLEGTECDQMVGMAYFDVGGQDSRRVAELAKQVSEH